MVPIVNSTTNYAGRQQDLLIFHGYSEPANVSITFGNPTGFCAGVQKLIQRYTISLLTALGSQSTFPDFGTDFIKDLQQVNSTYTLTDFTHLFNFVNLDVVNSFRSYQRDNPSNFPDEQLNTTVLASASIANQNINMTIDLTTMAGTVVSFLVPLPLNS